MPQEETKKELESKQDSENAQQVAPAPLTVQQLQQLNNTPISSADIWRHLILSPVTIVKLPDTDPSVEENSDTEPSSEDTVVPAVRRFAIEEGFSLNDFINLGKVSKFLNALVRQSIDVQNQMRALASTFPRFIPLQQAYFASQRVIDRIRGRQLTFNHAVADIAPNRLPTASTTHGAVNVSAKNTAVGLGVSPAEMQDDWFSEAHVEALQAGIPFEEIERLTTYQVQAMLATRNVDNVRPLARKDVISSNLGAEHIEALKKGTSFASIKKLSVLQLKALSVGFAEGDIRQLNTVQLNMLLHGASVKDITSPNFVQWFEKVKYSNNDIESLINQLLSKGYMPEQIIKLNLHQLEALCHHGSDFTLERVTNPIFLRLCQEYKGDSWQLRSNLAQALKAGYSLEDIAELNAWQLKALGKGDTIEQVTDPVFAELHVKFGEQFRWPIEKLLKQGVKPKEIAALTRLQLRALDNDDSELTLEKVRHPRFSESAHHAMLLGGYDFAEVINLEPWQHRLLAAGVSLEEAREPNPNITLKHVMAVQAGGNYQDIKSLNYAALEHYLAMPCSALPQQQPLPSRVARVESKDDRFLTPVIVHTGSDSSTSSSASSSYYAPGGSSSSSSSAASSAYDPYASSSTPAAPARSTLPQYQQHQPQTPWPSSFVDPADVDPAELLYSSGEENTERRRSPASAREQPH